MNGFAAKFIAEKHRKLITRVTGLIAQKKGLDPDQFEWKLKIVRKSDAYLNEGVMSLGLTKPDHYLPVELLQRHWDKFFPHLELGPYFSRSCPGEMNVTMLATPVETPLEFYFQKNLPELFQKDLQKRNSFFRGLIRDFENLEFSPVATVVYEKRGRDLLVRLMSTRPDWRGMGIQRVLQSLLTHLFKTRTISYSHFSTQGEIFARNWDLLKNRQEIHARRQTRFNFSMSRKFLLDYLKDVIGSPI